jgi:hypothetical protein
MGAKIMKDIDDMEQAIDAARSPRPAVSKLADFLLLLVASGGIGYCIGKFIAGDDFGMGDAAIIMTAAAIFFVLANRQIKAFPQVSRKQELTRYALQTGVGAIIGMAGMSAIILLLGATLKNMAERALYWNLAAAVLAALYILVALVLILLSANKKMVATKPGDEPLSDDEYKNTRTLFFWAALGMFAYGLILGITAFYGKDTGGPNWFALAALCCAVAGQWACSYILWRRYDELYREVTRTACAISYVVVEVLIVLWAGLTLFGFPVRFDPMAVLVVMMTISFVTTLTVSLRRGVS